jgi:serralysin
MHTRSIYTATNTPINGTGGADVITTPDLASVYVRTITYGNQYGIDGQAGDDRITGGYSDDEIRGGVGNDTISGSYGLNEIFGGDGIDTIDYSAIGTDPALNPLGVGLNISLSEGTKIGNGSGIQGAKFILSDQLLGFENVLGSSYGDRIFGNDESGNELYGLGGSDAIYGKDGNDLIYGGLNADTLSGGTGDDYLVGGRGKDSIDGGAGNDTIYGGKGADRLLGQGGADTYVYKKVSDSTAKASGRDSIRFKSAEGDKIDVSAIDANGKKPGNGKFKFIDTKKFSGNGAEVRYSYGTAANAEGELGPATIIRFDINGDKKADFAIALEGNKFLSAGDFIL